MTKDFNVTAMMGYFINIESNGGDHISLKEISGAKGSSFVRFVEVKDLSLCLGGEGRASERLVYI